MCESMRMGELCVNVHINVSICLCECICECVGVYERV